jgi:cobalamin biosynthesis protein CobD/CbiB
MGDTKPGRRLAPERGAAVVMALGLDMLGEPPATWHPVVWFGKLIHMWERGAPCGHLPQMLFRP